MRHHSLIARASRAGIAATLAVLAITACSGGGAATPAAAPVGPDGRPVPAPRPESIDDTSPEGAAAGFVAAEAAEAYDLSYGLLSSGDRDETGTVDDWRDRHSLLWPLAAGEVADTQADGDKATVEMRVRYHSVLEENLGLVPASATVRWAVVREGDRWRIAYDEGKVEPNYPADSDAAAGVEAWARSRQACQPAEEFDGGLIGFPALADELCRREGDIQVGPPTELESGPDADRLISAFGAEALDWARVVPLTQPAGLLRAVVAPIGDRWTVVGVLEPTPR
jgi:hypothetical protein